MASWHVRIIVDPEFSRVYSLLMSFASRLLVDIHTHVYLPRYASLLRSRSSVPFIRTNTTPEGLAEDRLLILDHEPSGGRPVGPQYWDREGMHLKLFMGKGLYPFREAKIHG